MKTFNYIDIFAGCGGLSLGLCNSGFKGVFAIEKNQDAFSTLKYNLVTTANHFDWPKWLPISEHDINVFIKEYGAQLEKMSGTITLVAGGPPCQGFSLAGKRNINDQRNQLVKSYVRFIRLIMPEAIVFENVHGFTVNFQKENGKRKKYSNYVINALKRAGYKTSSQIVDMSDFGVPQSRKRFILIAMRNHNPKTVFDILYKNRTEFLTQNNLPITATVKDAIDDLKVSSGTVISPDSKGIKAGIYGNASSTYQIFLRKNNDQNKKSAVDSHRFVNHSSRVVQLHKDLMKKAPRGKRITPSDGIVAGLKRRGVTVLDQNKPAPTITSIPDELVHYEEPRILTVREHARIQSFPDWYKFKGKYTSGGKRRKLEVPRYTQVGNAVPPLFAEQIGLALKEVLNDYGKR